MRSLNLVLLLLLLHTFIKALVTKLLQNLKTYITCGHCVVRVYYINKLSKHQTANNNMYTMLIRNMDNIYHTNSIGTYTYKININFCNITNMKGNV